MEQSNQPRKATPEQNANVVKQVSDIVIDRIIDEEVEKHLNTPETRTKLEMMAIYRQLTENTNYTRDASKNVLDELVKLTDLVVLYKSRLEQVEKDNKAINEKLAILAGQYKGHAERLEKLELITPAIKDLVERVNKLEKLK